MATYNYLDKIGLGQVWSKIKSLFTNTSLIGTTTAESIYTDELTSGNLIVNGGASFVNTISVGSAPTSDMNVATKKYVDDSIDASSISPNWNENDTTSPNYIENRTHWTDSPTITNVINETGTLANEGFRNLTMSLNPQDISLIQSVTNETSYTIVINGSTYSGTVLADGYGYIFFGNANLAIDDYESTGESYAIVYSEYDSRIYFTTNEGQVGDSYSVSLSIENTPIHKLDNKYLNGTLIQPGAGKNSEIFNGINEYKIASGAYSHVEGYNGGWNRMIQINLTGEAGATNYDCTVYSYRDGYNSIINAGIYSFADSNYSTIDKKITYIDVPLSLNNPKTGTIYFNETLSQDTNLSNKPFYLVLPQAIASGTGSHAEGGDAMATEYCSHAEGSNTIASGSYSHAEGNGTVASGSTSHAEGNNTTAFNNYSHAEGNYTIANGSTSHAEGNSTTASGNYSHAEGSNTTASGSYSHAEGYKTTASGVYSHTEGRETISQTRSQHVFGEYNVLDTVGSTTTKGNYIEIVGNGTSTSKRSNARTLDWNGNEVLAGKLTVGTAPTNDMDVATKQYVDNATSSITTNLSGLTDTTISSPTNGQFLQYNSTSSKWENKTYTAPVTSVNGQTGAVSITVPSASSTTPSADGTGTVGTSTTYARADHVHPKITQTISISSNVITLTGSDGTTSSVTIPTSGGTGGANSLSELNDTTITSPSDGQILRYDNSSSKWINSNETTYTFDGTYNASTNKVATVSTVTNAIGALTIPTKTSDLTNDSGFMTGMTILSYGNSSWADFIDAYNNKRVVYCRASSNSNPASGSQTRLAFMAYVNNAESPTEVEFQYYRSVSSHSNTQQGDQVYVYKLTKTGGWSVTVRESYTKVVAGTGLTGNWASGAITLSLNTTQTATTSANGLMSSTDKSRLDTLYADYSSALTALGVN